MSKMARCSTCKQENWPLHKEKGFLICERCIAHRYGGFRWRSIGWDFADMFTDAWHWVRNIYDRLRGYHHVSISTKASPAKLMPAKEVMNYHAPRIQRIGATGGWKIR